MKAVNDGLLRRELFLAEPMVLRAGDVVPIIASLYRQARLAVSRNDTGEFEKTQAFAIRM
jgi:hypothetical protein